MIAILQAIARGIETLRGSHLHVFYDNFVAGYEVQKISIKGDVIQLLRRIAMFCTEDNIKV